jgi:hypothetical protein
MTPLAFGGAHEACADPVESPIAAIEITDGSTRAAQPLTTRLRVVFDIGFFSDLPASQPRCEAIAAKIGRGRAEAYRTFV